MERELGSWEMGDGDEMGWVGGWVAGLSIQRDADRNAVSTSNGMDVAYCDRIDVLKGKDFAYFDRIDVLKGDGFCLL